MLVLDGSKLNIFATPRSVDLTVLRNQIYSQTVFKCVSLLSFQYLQSYRRLWIGFPDALTSPRDHPVSPLSLADSPLCCAVDTRHTSFLISYTRWCAMLAHGYVRN